MQLCILGGDVTEVKVSPSGHHIGRHGLSIWATASFLFSLAGGSSPFLLISNAPGSFPSVPDFALLLLFPILFPQNELREVREELKEKMDEIKQVTG